MPGLDDPLPLSATTVNPVRRSRFRNQWHELTFLSWPVDPDAVARRLPPGLVPDLHDGRAWVSLVPFEMRGNRLPFTPPLPRIARFAETNVRTYVVDGDGHRSVWFDSLDATSLPVVAAARVFLRFPYVWSRMSIDRTPGVIEYRTTRRRWPASPATSTVRVEIGEPVEPDELDLFLTARWSTVVFRGGRVCREPVDHPAWAFRSVRVLDLDDGLVAAAGYEVAGAPVARYVDRMDARFGHTVRPPHPSS